MADVAIVPLGAARVDELRELWLALHHAHRAVATVPLQPSDERSWSLRRADYLRWLAAGTAFALGAERAGRLVGYAVTRLHEGDDDTFDLGPRHAELWSLSVAPAERGRGIGSLLLDAVDGELEGRGIAHVTIAVMAGNEGARRLYERRGLVPGEILLFRSTPRCA
jgi:ribosomal protein S18 acetylase RimI-like enzyme